MIKKGVTLLILSLTLLGICAVSYLYTPHESEEPVFVETQSGEITFSHPSGIYTETIEVEITCPGAERIFYTVTGELPTEKSRRYKMAVELRAKEADSCTSITARGLYPDGSWSEPAIATYYVGKNADQRFDTPVVFLTCDPDKLFGYENGILVEGKLRDDFKKYNPGAEVISISPAGFNLRGSISEREVHFEMLDPSGTSVISQDLGVRPFGAYSRARKLKSIKLLPRYDYDAEQNKLAYTFFGTDYSNDGLNRLVVEYKRMVMHNSGNDNGVLMMKNALHQQLAGDAGFPDYTRCVPISVYINGDYYGFMWMNDTYCSEYFEDRYGAYLGVFEEVSGPERSKPDKRFYMEDMPAYAYDDFNFMYEKFSNLDLTVEENYAALCKVVDVENYLFYYAVNVAINNNDWPSNNHKAYRYYRSSDEEYKEGTVFDGRWRFLIHDVDNVLNADGNILNTYLLSKTASRRSPLFQKLMERADCRDYYITKCMELVNGAFSESNWVARIDEIHASRLNELTYYIENAERNATNFGNVDSTIKTMKSNASRRLSRMVIELKSAFKGVVSGSTYQLDIADSDNVFYTIGTYECESYSGKQLVEYGLSVVPTVAVGYRFDHWLVNGEAVYDEVLTVAPAKKDETITVSCVVEPVDDMPLLLTEISSEGSENDYMVLYNPNDYDVSTVGYMLSDLEENPKRFVLPARTVKAGETLKIYCDNNTDFESFHQIFAPFNLKVGETVYVSRGDELLQSVYIPDLRNTSTYVLNMTDGEFYEEAG